MLLHFDQPVVPGGYVWWYVDALSEDGRRGLTLIAFLGSVFSPYYAWARRRGAADPLNHCALNVAFYDAGRKHWTLTERGRHGTQRSTSSLSIGPSSLAREGDGLTIRFDEIAVPFPSRIRGVVRLSPVVLANRTWNLDAQGRHRWSPIAPGARVQVTLDQPALSWKGFGYLDSNAGDDPLEDVFERWDWSRVSRGHETEVLYDVARRDGTLLSLAVRFNSTGTAEEFTPPQPQRLPRTLWGISRRTRADATSRAVLLRTLEDTPFYARSLLSTNLRGERATAVHESLSLERFRAKWVQMLLPFRMPRNDRWSKGIG